MKNKEFYRDEIFEIACEHSKVAVVNGEPANCRSLNGCTSCEFYTSEVRCEDGFKDWLEKEHEEQKIQPEVKSLKKDDRVLVSIDGVDWIKRYFEKYDQEEGVVYAYNNGTTSWTSEGAASRWTYAKLPEDELEEEPETDWLNVLVDTRIFVKNNKDSIWFRRHFAKYENGKVYAYIHGQTSFTTGEYEIWDCAELAEDKE